MSGITCAFQGHVGRDVELRYTRSGAAVLTFSVTVEDGRAGQVGPTTWVRVTARGALAESLGGRLVHGADVYVEGRLRLRQRSGRGGEHRCTLDVSAQTVQPMGRTVNRAASPEPASEEWRRPLPSRPDAAPTTE